MSDVAVLIGVTLRTSKYSVDGAGFPCWFWGIVAVTLRVTSVAVTDQPTG